MSTHDDVQEALADSAGVDLTGADRRALAQVANLMVEDPPLAKSWRDLLMWWVP